MHVIKSHEQYFKTVSDYNRAPGWQKDMLLRGTLLSKCNEIEPVSVRHRLRRFWVQEAAKRDKTLQTLQTWK
ncbi:hypothetical protein ASG58_21325 [Rhizobium sp. Leaf383]|nr:hypothetical protein ASG58_21325 [Rhizobium sp. Leaf383]